MEGQTMMYYDIILKDAQSKRTTLVQVVILFDGFIYFNLDANFILCLLKEYDVFHRVTPGK